MTITQTIEIPTSHKLHLDLDIPPEIPTGQTSVIIHFPVKNEVQPSRSAGKKIGMSKDELDKFLKDAHTPISDSLLGILKTDMTVDEIRMARLAKHA